MPRRRRRGMGLHVRVPSGLLLAPRRSQRRASADRGCTGAVRRGLGNGSSRSMAGALAVASRRRPGRSVGTRARTSRGARRRRPCRGLCGRAHHVAPAMPAPLQCVPWPDVEGAMGPTNALAQNCKLLIRGKAIPSIRICKVEVAALPGKLGGRGDGRPGTVPGDRLALHSISINSTCTSIGIVILTTLIWEARRVWR